MKITHAAASFLAGVATFTVCGILKCELDEYTREALPFLAAVITLIIVMILFPEIVLFLPNLVFWVFRSIKGACSFVVLRSMLDTAIKNWQDPLNALRAVAEYIVPEKDLVAAE